MASSTVQNRATLTLDQYHTVLEVNHLVDTGQYKGKAAKTPVDPATGVKNVYTVAQAHVQTGGCPSTVAALTVPTA